MYSILAQRATYILITHVLANSMRYAVLLELFEHSTCNITEVVDEIY